MQTLPAGLVSGATFTDRAYVSTTASKKIAGTFQRKSKEPVEMRITLPKGARVLPMAYATRTKRFEKEQEILLPRNARFKVGSVEKVGSRTIVSVEYQGTS
jgi:hypothetical protein